MEETLQKKEIIKKRQSNFELLRIICMILIVAHHLSVHSKLPENVTKLNLYIHQSLEAFGKIAVNIFVLISGYFMINSKFTFKKVFKLIFQIIFYDLMIYFGFCVFGLETFNLGVFIHQIFPTYFNQYWFMSYYIILYMISPFLNKALKQCSVEEFIILLSILLVFQLNIFETSSLVNFSNFAWFITLYTTAAFIRLHFDNNGHVAYAYMTFVISLAIIFIFAFCFKIKCWDISNILSYLLSVSTFYIFKHINIKHSKFINLIASTTLGVYLIHDNRFIRPYIWNIWLNIPYHATINNFWLFCICAIMLVFITCSIFDLIRLLIDKICTKLIKRRKKQEI